MDEQEVIFTPAPELEEAVNAGEPSAESAEGEPVGEPKPEPLTTIWYIGNGQRFPFNMGRGPYHEADWRGIRFEDKHAANAYINRHPDLYAWGTPSGPPAQEEKK